MRIIHDSRTGSYRSPFGAVTAGSQITLAIEIEGPYAENVRLMLWHGEDPSPEYINMKETPGNHTGAASGIRYETVISAPAEGCLLWYAFAIEAERDDLRQVFYYGNNEDGLGGEGRIYHDDPCRYQITVYKESAVPSWYKDGIVYQIFPDRFARDEEWRERCEASIEKTNSRPAGTKRLIEEDWNRKAYYVRDHGGRVTGWPIYGGSFKGIENKLEYLRSLGVTVIYLNPIFEATSNHRYDTGDYMKPDMALGTEEDFAHLTAAAKECGIRIILDGVFNHTGCDSVYFDRYGNYGTNGAYQSEDSPYRNWFRFDSDEPCGYRSWWGVDDLPEVNEEDPGFRELITGEEGVLAHWMKLGASGWRLDVADELPDDFICEIRNRIRKTDPEGLIIGEVWEDASNKISYGERRKYFMGEELDGVMNYPLRTLLLDYINYTVSSGYAGRNMLSLQENYPKENFYGGLNLIGSHDRERLITEMAAEEEYTSADRKVRILSTLQYTLPGVPCIYYGDEVGLTGKADPENRNGYPWGYENLDLGYHYRMLGLIYDEHPVLKEGDLTMLSGSYGISDDVFAFTRSGEEYGEKILVLANRSYGPTEVDLRNVREAAGGYALELLTSTVMKTGPDGFRDVLVMEPLSTLVICIMDEEPAREDLGKGAGVICHISSLGKGVLGSPARDFADYLASAGMNVWQVLPLNPAGLGGSPYSSYAAFAGEPALINRDELPDLDGYEEFCRSNMDWLSEYAVFTLLREMHDGISWTEWPEEYRSGDPLVLMNELAKDKEHADRLRELVLDQYYFYRQWKDLKDHAGSLGIRMMGDIPMYMACDSADVWANQEFFRLDEKGRLRVHAGVPPDAFSEEGQDWGNPLYDWEKLKANGYSWWIRRLKQCAERFDILRIDHFRGLSEYYSIPEGGKPSAGVWQHSGGLGFLRALAEMLREDGDAGMKVLAEDLGFLDAGVKNLLKLSGMPGMNIWQFNSEEMLEMSEEEAVSRAFYTGTHDNDTLIGFLREKLVASGEHKEEAPEEVSTEAEIEALRIFRTIYESPAVLAMMQLQDMFLLGTEARMNVPGIPEGNWSWKIPGDTIREAFPDAEERAAWFRELAEKTGRI